MNDKDLLGIYIDLVDKIEDVCDEVNPYHKDSGFTAFAKILNLIAEASEKMNG